jgi:hypothetical protein
MVDRFGQAQAFVIVLALSDLGLTKSHGCGSRPSTPPRDAPTEQLCAAAHQH